MQHAIRYLKLLKEEKFSLQLYRRFWHLSASAWIPLQLSQSYYGTWWSPYRAELQRHDWNYSVNSSKSLKCEHKPWNNNRNIKQAGCDSPHLLPVLHLCSSGWNFFSTTEGIQIDGRDDGYLTSEAGCQLTIRTVTNRVGCDGNDGDMQIVRAASNPDVITLLCAQALLSLPLCRWFDLMIFSEYSDILEHSICRHGDKTTRRRFFISCHDSTIFLYQCGVSHLFPLPYTQQATLWGVLEGQI